MWLKNIRFDKVGQAAPADHGHFVGLSAKRFPLASGRGRLWRKVKYGAWTVVEENKIWSLQFRGFPDCLRCYVHIATRLRFSQFRYDPNMNQPCPRCCYYKTTSMHKRRPVIFRNCTRSMLKVFMVPRTRPSVGCPVYLSRRKMLDQDVSVSTDACIDRQRATGYSVRATAKGGCAESV